MTSTTIPEIVSCAEAKARGDRFYFTGKPCKHGHLAQRHTSNRTCIVCDEATMRERSRRYEERNKERRCAKSLRWNEHNRDKVLANKRRYYKRNKALISERQRKYAENNKAKIAEYHRQYRATNRDKIRDRTRQNYALNREKYCEYARKRRAQDPEYQAAYQATYRATNPEAINTYIRKRRARKRRAQGTHTAADIAEILRLQRGRCAYCRKRLGKRYHVDHIVALAAGGSNDRRNLQVTCGTCNTRKHDIDPILFAQRLGKLI